MKYKSLIKYGIAILIAYQLGSCRGRFNALEEHGIEEKYYKSSKLEKLVDDESRTKKTG